MIKIMKPQDHMTYEMIDIARKTSQQVRFRLNLVTSLEERAAKYGKKSQAINKVKKGLDF